EVGGPVLTGWDDDDAAAVPVFLQVRGTHRDEHSAVGPDRRAPGKLEQGQVRRFHRSTVSPTGSGSFSARRRDARRLATTVTARMPATTASEANGEMCGAQLTGSPPLMKGRVLPARASRINLIPMKSRITARPLDR